MAGDKADVLMMEQLAPIAIEGIGKAYAAPVLKHIDLRVAAGGTHGSHSVGRDAAATRTVRVAWSASVASRSRS